MKIRFFAQCRQTAGCEEFLLKITGPVSEAEFWSQLIAAVPALAPFRKTARLARGEAYLERDAQIFPDDEIAVIPPVSGG